MTQSGNHDLLDKKFKLSEAEIRPLAEGFGACIATDKILVDGMRVSFMYRESPDHDADSGWRFLSGYESEEYMGNPDNHGIYDVNTIANYDPDILAFLESPEGTAFERDASTGKFVKVRFEVSE